MKLGMRKAIKKASISAEAPKNEAKTVSRNKPKIRDRKVIKATTEVDLNNCLLIFILPNVICLLF